MRSVGTRLRDQPRIPCECLPNALGSRARLADDDVMPARTRCAAIDAPTFPVPMNAMRSRTPTVSRPLTVRRCSCLDPAPIWWRRYGHGRNAPASAVLDRSSACPGRPVPSARYTLAMDAVIDPETTSDAHVRFDVRAIGVDGAVGDFTRASAGPLVV